MKGRKQLLLCLAVLLIAAAAAAAAYGMGHILPFWIRWQTAEISGGPVQGQAQRISLRDRTVRVYDREAVIWQSDEGVAVQDVLWSDIDRDGQKELLLLCWRRGRYGDSRPFWVEKNEKTWSQHIFIYDWTADGVWPVWMASDIGLEAVQWEFDETRRLVITDREGRVTAWDWLSWGLQRIELQPAQLTFAAVGDNLIHFQIYDYALRHFDGCFDSLFDGVRQELERYDVTSINQETIYVDRPEQYGTYPSFGTPVEVGEAVVKAGFDIVSAATNHALDRGVEAVDLTVSLYEQAGVVCAGLQSSGDPAYRPYEILERNSIRCAVFGYTQLSNTGPAPRQTPHVLHLLEDEEQIRRDLLAGRAEADVCIVYVHWGTEYADTPDETQRHWAQVFADCGADVVIGTHPHVLQPWQWLEGKDGHRTLVYYSLGNFISAQTEPACREGGMAWFTVTKQDGAAAVTDCGLKTLITREENGLYTTAMRE